MKIEVKVLLDIPDDSDENQEKLCKLSQNLSSKLWDVPLWGGHLSTPIGPRIQISADSDTCSGKVDL
jgi:hypothetical protein